MEGLSLNRLPPRDSCRHCRQILRPPRISTVRQSQTFRFDNLRSYDDSLIRVDHLVYPPLTRPLGPLPDPYPNPGGYLIPRAPKRMKNNEFELKSLNFLVTQGTLKSFGTILICVFKYPYILAKQKLTNKISTPEFPFTRKKFNGEGDTNAFKLRLQMTTMILFFQVCQQ